MRTSVRPHDHHERFPTQNTSSPAASFSCVSGSTANCATLNRILLSGNYTLYAEGRISRSFLKKPFLLPVWVYTFGAHGGMYRSPVWQGTDLTTQKSPFKIRKRPSRSRLMSPVPRRTRQPCADRHSHARASYG